MSQTFDCLLVKPVHKGQCIARVNGKVLLVQGGIPGEKVSVEIVEEKKSYSVARVVKVILPSPSRVSGVWREGEEKGLGGLELSHVAYPDQLKWKTDVLNDSFLRIAGEKVLAQLKELPPINVRDINTRSGYAVHGLPPAKDHTHWRTRMVFVADKDSNLGMSKYHTNDILAVETMPLASKKILDSGILGKNGILKSVLSPGDIVYCVVDSQDDVYFTVNDVTYDVNGEIINNPVLIERVKTFASDVYEYKVNPTSFWQIHEKAPNILVDTVLKASSGQDFSSYSDFNPLALGDSASNLGEKIRQSLAGKKVLELYSGSGLFTKPLADYVGKNGKIVAIEGDRQATQSAKENLKDSLNVECFKANIDGKLISKVISKYGQFDVVVADPSRSGCGKEVVQKICAESGAEYFVYIACDIASLSRDIKVAVENGYKIAQIVSYDLFPHTHHFETVALLERVQK